VPRPLPALLVTILLAATVGCGSESPARGDQPPSKANAGSPPQANSAFDPNECGTVTGLVTWTGPIPEVPQVQHITPRPNGTGYETRLVTLPNAPRIDPSTRGLAGAVVYFREVNQAQAKPWDWPPVTIEFRDLQLVVNQGDRSGRTGLVRRGDSISMQSSEPVFHILRGRGAAFFSLAFPDPDKPLTLTLDTPGHITLTNPAGYYWQRADLFVCDHPYYAITDADGRFHFTQVPAGPYQLMAWHPNWVITRQDRNPETGLPSQLHFAEPLETSRPVTVSAGRLTLANLNLPK
jgi:hypothetical protein